MKTIAGFSNAEGGTLIIGVDDEGEIIGLDNDYTTLKGNRDEFELHLRNLINQNFGKIFASNNIEITIPISDVYELCHIEVKRGINPVYLTFVDKNGVKTEKFYIRSGNSTQELSVSEIASYVNARFDG
jgi:predicted HTH transcriptional regulator